jgi:hypothetical protein
MDDLVQRLRRYSLRSGYARYCHRAADRIEQLERENETNERNLCQLTDELAVARRENVELRKQLSAIPITQFPQSFRDDLAEAIRLGKVTIS